MRLFPDAFENGKDLFPRLTDKIGVIHIPAVIADAAHNLDVVINPGWEENANILRYLISDIDAFRHPFLTGFRLIWDIEVIVEGVETHVHTVGVFLVAHIRDINFKGLQDLIKEPLGVGAEFWEDKLADFVMSDIVIEL